MGSTRTTPADFFGIEQRVAAHDQPTEGVAHENVRRLDAGGFEHLVQLRGNVAGCARRAAGAAPAQAGTIVGDGVGKRRNRVLNAAPVEMRGADSGFEENCRFAPALLKEVEAATAADVHQAALTGVNAAVAETAEVLIDGSGENEKRKRTRESKKRRASET
jgi:hypothetical protein